MFGFGFGSKGDGGAINLDSLDEDVDESELSAVTPPWLKKQKLQIGSPEVEENFMDVGLSECDKECLPSTSHLSESSHSQAVKLISQQLGKYRIERALKSMKMLPNFDRDFNKFVRDECRRQADNILKNKDPPVSDFDSARLYDFDYKKEIDKLQVTVPTLMASIAGTISSSRADLVDISRKGFGGSRQSDDISLVPAMVQTASCILRNRHPNCISTVPCVNSVNNYLNHLTKQYFFLQNSLGFSYR